MKTLRLVLGDQLSRDLPSLTDLDPDTDLVLMAEVMSEVTYVKHHKRKIAYLFSAMRHFAEALGKDGIAVRYRRLDDAERRAKFIEMRNCRCRARPAPFQPGSGAGFQGFVVVSVHRCPTAGLA